ncbi:MAG: hypothetical protein ACYCWB_15915, partial [Thiobacillus sp.]
MAKEGRGDISASQAEDRGFDPRHPLQLLFLLITSFAGFLSLISFLLVVLIAMISSRVSFVTKSPPPVAGC